jgi:hypothetical protein
MSSEALTLFARLAWIEAYILQFGRDDPNAVLAALGVAQAALGEARETLREATEAGRARGDLTLSWGYDNELMRARVVLAVNGLTLDQIVTLLARRQRDDLALPDVVLSGP